MSYIWQDWEGATGRKIADVAEHFFHHWGWIEDEGDQVGIVYFDYGTRKYYACELDEIITLAEIGDYSRWCAECGHDGFRTVAEATENFLQN